MVAEQVSLLPTTEDEASTRLDKHLVAHLPDHSRERLKGLIVEGQVTLNGKVCTTPAYKVQAGDEIVVEIPPLETLDVLPENIPLTVLYEDDHLLVIDKPSGLTVHPAPGQWTGTLVNALLHHCGDSLSGINGMVRPGIVHRLDKDTSGTMVVAKSDKAHRHLAKQFEERTLGRFYLALCYGVPMPPRGEVVTNIGRHPKHRKKMAVLQEGGKHAHTLYETVEAFGQQASLMRLKLMTGRTHQIRIHMAHLGHPVLNDPVYNNRRRWPTSPVLDVTLKALQGQALHAAHLQFVHPQTKEEMGFETPPPPAFQKVLDILKEIS